MRTFTTKDPVSYPDHDYLPSPTLITNPERPLNLPYPLCRKVGPLHKFPTFSVRGTGR